MWHPALPVTLQEQRNILALAVGLKGIAAIRAVLSWAPVQAHASSHRVTAYYVTKSPSSAAFLSEWDQWREAGVRACTHQWHGGLPSCIDTCRVPLDQCWVWVLAI